MKKLLCLFVLLGAVYASNAQELGVRFGDAPGGDIALDAVFGFWKFDRIHADASFSNGFGLEVLPTVIYKPIGGEAFNWYVGVGPSFVFGDPFVFGVAGEIGLEYRFNEVPIALGGDWRPLFRLVEDTDFVLSGFGFNARFIFND